VNFIRLYIGDYLRDTGTLTVAEHGAYMLMLLNHYATEKPLPMGRELHRLLRAETKAERDAIDAVSSRFWTATEGGLVNGRAGREMERAEHQREVNRTVGKLGGRPKRTETESVSESVTNGNRTETLTRHQTPDTIKKPPSPSAKPPLPDGVDPQVWSDWLALRKAKKAPVTATVVDGAMAEAKKAGMSLDAFLRVWCARGSQGLQAEWLKPNERPGQPAQTSNAPPIFKPERPMTAEEKEANRRAAQAALAAIKRVPA
jgi:uncharacterized protein YdaU (DUF1376 family)